MIDIVPTILEAIGIEMPSVVNSVQQAPIEGVPMNYTFDNPAAPTTHPTQYFEMLGNRALVDNGWKVVTNHGRKPWENKSNQNFDDDHWELYNLNEDPSECHDLMENREPSNLKDPMVQKLIQLVGLWWAEAGRYNVLPLDDRFIERAMSGVMALMEASKRMKVTFYPGAVRIPMPDQPFTLNCSWSMRAEVEIPEKGAEGPICVTGGDNNGWSLYMKDGKIVYCYNLIGRDFTYIRSQDKVPSRRHNVLFEFEKTGQGLGAGGVGRIYVDGKKVAEGTIPVTLAFGGSLSETMDIGCDKGSPVTPEYKARAEFTGKIIQVDFDLKPDLHHDLDKHAETHARLAMMRQ